METESDTTERSNPSPPTDGKSDEVEELIETLRDAREKAKEGGKSVLVEGPGVLNEKPTWRSLESGVVVEPNGKCHFMSQE